ncbi:glycosyltransferase family 39 protein [Clostridium butyricum]
MKIENIFLKFSYIIFFFMMLLSLAILLSSVDSLYGSIYILIIAILFMVISIFLLKKFKSNIESMLKDRKKEYILVFVILAISLFLRILVVENISIQPKSDYRIYYEVANHINDGTLQEYSNQIKNTTENVFRNGFDINYLNFTDYIAKLPHVYFYSFILSIIFKLFGNSIKSGLYFGVFSNIVCIIFCYKIAKRLSGKFVGLLAIILIGFFPSIIIYNSILGAESIFTAILFGCILLFLNIKKVYSNNKFKYYILTILLGIISAINSAIRSVGIIFFVSLIIYFVIDKSYEKRILKYTTIIFIIISYITMSTVMSNYVTRAISKPIASKSSAFGYSLMIGTNEKYNGQWNSDDYRNFFDYSDKLKSATNGQKACFYKGIERIYNSNFREIINLFFNKYKILWGNSNFAIDFNYIFLSEQGELNNNINVVLKNSKILGNVFYFICVLFTFIESLFIYKRKSQKECYILVLLLIGTMITHVFLEVQNRYQYHILPVMCILGAMGIYNILCKLEDVKH